MLPCTPAADLSFNNTMNEFRDYFLIMDEIDSPDSRITQTVNPLPHDTKVTGNIPLEKYTVLAANSACMRSEEFSFEEDCGKGNV